MSPPNATPAAQSTDAAVTPTPSPRPLRRFVLTIVLGALAFGTASFSCVPASQRLAAPVVCPADTVESVVVSRVTRNDRGTIVTLFDFHCIDSDGGSTMPPPFVIFGTLVGYGVVVVALAYAVVRLRARLGATTAAALATVLLGGCEFGTLTRAEYEARYPYGAGPMLSDGRAVAAARTLAQRLGATPRVTAVNLSAESITVTVVVRGSERDTDLYILREDEVSGPTPMQGSEGGSLAAEVFELTPELLAPVPNLVREATRRVGFADGHVDSLVLRRAASAEGPGPLEFQADVESPRRRGRVRFDVAGRLLDATTD